MTGEDSLAAARARVEAYSIAELADAIQDIGFACTRCGGCCRGHEGDSHTATVFPDEVRSIADTTAYDWRDIVRPMPFGLNDGGEGETVEWALETDECGDCRFLEERCDGRTACGIYEERPGICRTYPFSLVDTPGGQPMGDAVERSGPVIAHECEGLGTDIDRERAQELARQLRRRSLEAIDEAIAVRDQLQEDHQYSESTVVVDSEGPKSPDGTPL